MRTRRTTIRLWIHLLLLSGALMALWAQRTPDPNVGDPIWRRQGIMDGNLVRTIFINWGEIAHWPDSPSGEWPKGTGHQYVDGVALIVQARAIDNNGNVIHPMETQYREFVDTGPKGELWGWAPLPGYFYPKSTEPAMSDDPSTWPDVWPDQPDWVNPGEVRDGIDNDENGLVDDVVFWNGFFGKGVRNADLETYFVFDDDPDEEWDFYPDPTDTTRRGLGLEVAARYFQWSQVLAEDVIFAVYFITNEGKTNYDSVYYAFYIDWGVGGTDDSSDDTGEYDLTLDIAWAWDYDGYGTPGRWFPVGVAGFAFLESPGIKDDNVDNDDDGLVDERRDSGPGVWLDTYPYGVDDVEKFIQFYGREPRPHWSGDEDQDWRPYEDVNENGQWDPGEPLNDDVGADGIGPLDPNYTGPDEGEADGIPTDGEPNFDKTDKDESDQIGLTGFRIFPVHTYELWNEEQNWKVFKSAPPPSAGQVTANLGMFFSSGSFPLKAGQTENYSMALIFAEDRDDLIRTKKTVQQIYNADYRFAKPPDKPRLIAIPGDKKVTLIWDTRAEQSYDPFLQEYDFEGYRIYRSTEPEFLERRLITDAYGRLTFRKPIAQFDLKNGIKGLHPIDVQGVKFDLGEDTGLRHVYVDTDVQNGQTYYYAVVSYDRGFVDTSAIGTLEGIAPSECPSVIKVDIAGNVQVDINTAVVTPTAPAAGYVPPELDGEIIRETAGTGDFEVQFIIPDSIRDGHTYQVEFADTTVLHDRGTPFYMIYDITDGQKVLKLDTSVVHEETVSPIVDGFVVKITNHTEVDVDPLNTGWLIGDSNLKWDVSLDDRFAILNTKYPADYEIRFSDQIIDTSYSFLGFPAVPTKFSVYNLTEDRPAKFIFREYYDQYRDSTLTPVTEDQSIDSLEQILIVEENPESILKYSTTWRLVLEVDPTRGKPRYPQPGDVFRIATFKPFRTGDRFTFKLRGSRFDREKAKSDLDRIAVVPNPYVVAASWEPRSPFRFGRGERRIYFINLPPKCTIRIYTIRGYLVDVIEHNSDVNNGQAAWNLLSKDNQEIAYGVYIYHVEAPGIGEKIGKFAIIK
ncbi:MAG: hypothetical protein GXO78_15245 [Calditrichaeota bacterium]|nr:hypothetical protein [Calditrichota bacterium]